MLTYVIDLIVRITGCRRETTQQRRQAARIAPFRVQPTFVMTIEQLLNLKRLIEYILAEEWSLEAGVESFNTDIVSRHFTLMERVNNENGTFTVLSSEHDQLMFLLDLVLERMALVPLVRRAHFQPFIQTLLDRPRDTRLNAYTRTGSRIMHFETTSRFY